MKPTETSLWKQYRNDIMITVLLMALPIAAGLLTWNRIPDSLPIHFGFSGQADSFSDKATAIFVPGLLDILTFLLVIWFLFRDPKQEQQNSRAIQVLFLVFPIIALLAYVPLYSWIFGFQVKTMKIIFLLMAVILIITGNVLGKVQQNSTYGVRLPWTLASRENWKKTNRLFGFLSVIAGFLILGSFWLPDTIFLWISLGSVLGICAITVLYSWYEFRKEGNPSSLSKKDRRSFRLYGLLLVAVVIGAGLLLFTGSVSAEVDLADHRLEMNASGWSTCTVDLNQIENIQLEKNFDPGTRENGYGSFTIQAGTFQNEKLGTYTLYKAYSTGTVLILHTDDGIYVIGLKNEKDTEELYDQLRELLKE